MNAIEIVCDIARTTAMKHREEGRRALADQIDTALAALMVPTHRHVKTGGDYALLGFGKMQSEDWQSPLPGHVMLHRVDMREVAIYRSVEDGSLWIRPREEFEDGRFVAIDDALTPMTDNARIDEGKLIEQARAIAAEQRTGAVHPCHDTLTALADALARRSIQEQPEAVAWREIYKYENVDDPKNWRVHNYKIPDDVRIIVEPLYAAPPPIGGAGWKDAAAIAWGNETPIPDKLPSDPREAFVEGSAAASQLIAEAIEALPPVPDNTDARGAQVKALGWHQNIDGLCLSEGGLVRYRVNQPTNANVWRWATSANGPFSEPFSTLDDAKAAAQADYASRIRAAIIPGTDASGVIEQANALAAAARNDALDAAADTCHDVGASEAERLIRSMRGTIAPPASAYALDPVKAQKP